MMKHDQFVEGVLFTMTVSKTLSITNYQVKCMVLKRVWDLELGVGMSLTTGDCQDLRDILIAWLHISNPLHIKQLHNGHVTDSMATDDIAITRARDIPYLRLRELLSKVEGQ